MMACGIDLDLLLRLRLVVARFGEMDGARWWNSRGQLGKRGVTTLRRGFPRTHRFAQARSVFTLAAHRCDEIYNPLGSVTLWRLPATIEEEFDARWEQWLDHAETWSPFFEQLASPGDRSLAETLGSLGLVGAKDLAAAEKLSRPAEARAVKLPAAFSGTDDDVRLLALGFGHGEIGNLVVPFAYELATT
ncbi:BrxE family protein [Parafrankia sp. FMc2]|uniref:BrxE family protein n=1 Tax=Parafrankia sp. FMc2 TaxID=3233196 RepID=UPI0034D70350